MRPSVKQQVEAEPLWHFGIDSGVDERCMFHTMDKW